MSVRDGFGSEVIRSTRTHQKCQEKEKLQNPLNTKKVCKQRKTNYKISWIWKVSRNFPYSRDFFVSLISRHFPYLRGFVVSPVSRHFWTFGLLSPPSWALQARSEAWEVYPWKLFTPNGPPSHSWKRYSSKGCTLTSQVKTGGLWLMWPSSRYPFF